MTESLLFSITVPGKPRPQGSLALWRGDDGIERAKYSPEMVQHRSYVVDEIRRSWGWQEPIPHIVGVQCEFRFRRPASHTGTGRNHGVLKPSAPTWAHLHVDTDKLARLVNDALVLGGVLVDDDLVVQLHGEKRWGPRDETMIEVWSVE